MSWSTDEDSLQIRSMASSLTSESPPNYNATMDTNDTIEAVGEGDIDLDSTPGARSRYNPRYIFFCRQLIMYVHTKY